MAPVNKVHHVYTIARVAEMLGEDEDWLWDVANEIDQEDGLIWDGRIYLPARRTGGRQGHEQDVFYCDPKMGLTATGMMQTSDPQAVVKGTLHRGWMLNGNFCRTVRGITARRRQRGDGVRRSGAVPARLVGVMTALGAVRISLPMSGRDIDM